MGKKEKKEKKEEDEEEEKEVKVCAIAKPLASDKLGKKVLSVIKKGTHALSLGCIDRPERQIICVHVLFNKSQPMSLRQARCSALSVVVVFVVVADLDRSHNSNKAQANQARG